MTQPGNRDQTANLVIAGVTKAGTTSLFRYLGQHPDICPSSVKEARYFSSLMFGEPPAPIEQYTALFEHCGGQRYRLEATPLYFPGGRRIATAIRELTPSCRVVISFRDPVQRCWSYYRFVRSTTRIPKRMTFAAYLDRCVDRDNNPDRPVDRRDPFGGIRVGCYDLWFDDWIDVFGDRLHVVFFEDLIASPQAVVRELSRALDIDEHAYAGTTFPLENRTVQYRNKRLQLLALSFNRSGERFFGRHPSLKRRLRAAYYRFNADTSRELLDPGSRERLAEYYAPHNARLAASLHAAGVQRLPGWLSGVGQA